MSHDEKACVLIVGNDVAVLDSLKFFLQLQGFDVRTYSNEAGLLATTDWPFPGCLLIEQNLPKISGLHLLSALRDRGVSLPAILITSTPTAELEQRATDAGVLQVLGKPLAHDLLLQILRHTLQQPGS